MRVHTEGGGSQVASTREPPRFFRCLKNMDILQKQYHMSDRGDLNVVVELLSL